MSGQSKLSGHWSDEELVASLYGVGPEDGHAAGCPVCQARVSEMRAARASNDAEVLDQLGPSRSFLHEQRRRIYESLARPRRWWAVAPFGRWAPGAAALVLLLSGGVALYEQQHSAPIAHQQPALTDAQLAQDVSQMADSEEPVPAAPLRALFE